MSEAWEEVLQQQDHSGDQQIGPLREWRESQPLKIPWVAGSAPREVTRGDNVPSYRTGNR